MEAIFKNIDLRYEAGLPLLAQEAGAPRDSGREEKMKRLGYILRGLDWKFIAAIVVIAAATYFALRFLR